MANEASAFLKGKYYRIRLLFLMLIYSSSTQEIYGSISENNYTADAATGNSIESNTTTSNRRGTWHHVQLEHIGQLSGARSSEARSGFLSSTILMKLIPYEYAMNDYQTTVYENGLQKFLNAQFDKQKYGLKIKDVSVIKNEIAMVDDRKQTFTEEDHVLQVKSIVLAEPSGEPSPLTSEDFSNKVVSYCNQLSDNLIFFWRYEEDNTIDRSDDRFEDYITFAHVFDIKVEPLLTSDHEGKSTQEKDGSNGFILLILTVFILLFCVLFTYRYRRKRGEQGHFDSIKDTDSDDTGSVSTISSRSSQKRTFFPRKKKKYGIVENEGGVVVFNKNVNALCLPKKNRVKHKYNKVGDTFSMDEQSASSCSSVDDKFDDDISLSSIRSTILRGRSVVQNECSAPAGKLGVSIDTVDNQPVVHRVKENSPLHGILQRLDIIIGIDEINTSSMSAADVTLLMAKRMRNERQIIFLRGVDKNNEV